MRYFRIFGLFCFFFLPGGVSSANADEIFLDDLWRLSLDYDDTALAADYFLQLAVIQNQGRHGIASSSVQLGGSARIDDPWLSLSGGVTLPGGASVNTSLFTDFSDEEAADALTVTVGFSQGLYPFWLQGAKQDPALASYGLAVKSREFQRAVRYRDLVMGLTHQIIQWRHYGRTILYLEQSVELGRLEVSSLAELNRLGQIPTTQFWEREQSLWDEELLLISSREQYLDYQFQIRESTGFENLEEFRIVLPERERFLRFKSEYIGGAPPELGVLDIRRREWVNRVIQRKQSNAPSLGVNFSLPVAINPDVQISEYWSLDLTLNLTSLLSPENRRQKRVEVRDRERLIQEEGHLLREREDRRVLLVSNIERLTAQTARIREYLDHARKLLEYAKRQHEMGEISLLEYRKAELNVLQKNNALEDAEDQLWYHRFLLDWQ